MGYAYDEGVLDLNHRALARALEDVNNLGSNSLVGGKVSYFEGQTASPSNSSDLAFVHSNDTEIIRETFRVYGSIYLVFFLVFCILRWKSPKLYNIRSWVPELKCKLAIKQRYGFFSWCWKVFSVSDDDILDNCGMDALCFLRCLRLGAKLSALGTINATWLLPLYFTAEEAPETSNLTDKFVLMSIANLPNNSRRFIGSVVAIYIIVLGSMYLISMEYEWYTEFRHKHLSKSAPRNYAIYVAGIPKEYRSSYALADYFRKCSLSESVLEAHVAMDIPTLEAKVARREKVVASLEHSVALERKHGVTKTHRTYKLHHGREGVKKVETVRTYLSELEELNKQIASAAAETKKTNDRLRQHLKRSNSFKRSDPAAEFPRMRSRRMRFEEAAKGASQETMLTTRTSSSLSAPSSPADDPSYCSVNGGDIGEGSARVASSDFTCEDSITDGIDSTSTVDDSIASNTLFRNPEWNHDKLTKEFVEDNNFNANSGLQNRGHCSQDQFNSGVDSGLGSPSIPENQVEEHESSPPGTPTTCELPSVPYDGDEVPSLDQVAKDDRDIEKQTPSDNSNPWPPKEVGLFNMSTRLSDGVRRVGSGIDGAKMVGSGTSVVGTAVKKAPEAVATKLKLVSKAGFQTVRTAGYIGAASVKMATDFSIQQIQNAPDIGASFAASAAAVVPLRLQVSEGEPREAGFVVFNDLYSTQAARQMLQHPSATQMLVEPAPNPEEIFWRNVGLPAKARRSGYLLSIAATSWLCFFWSIPSAFLSSLTEVNSLKEKLPVLEDWIDDAPGIESVLALLAPLFLLILNEIVLPIILKWFATWEGHVAASALEASLFVKLSAFVFIQMFFISAVSGTITAELTNILDHPERVVELLANSLPAQSSYFIQICFVFTFFLQGFDLLRAYPLVLAACRRYCFGPRLTAKERRKTWNMFHSLEDPPEFWHAEILAQIMLFFVVLFVYSAIAPITSIFLLFCFVVCESGYRYHFIHNQKPTPDSGGRLWQGFIQMLLVSMLIGECTLFGLLILKKTVYALPALAPLGVATVLFMIVEVPKGNLVSGHLPTLLCAELDKKHGEDEDYVSTFASKTYLQPALRDDIKCNVEGLLGSAEYNPDNSRLISP